MRWINKPSKRCLEMFGIGITEEEEDKYFTLQRDNKKADSFEMMSAGDERLKEQLQFLEGGDEDEC